LKKHDDALCALMSAACGCSTPEVGDLAPGITLREEWIRGERAVIMENSLYQTMMIPGKAMLPVTYFYKPTGHDLFLRRAKIEQSFEYLDGWYDCLPWVGDSQSRVANKGLLRTATWAVKSEVADHQAKVRFSTEISYPDPVTDRPNQLSFVKTIVGSSWDSQLRMDYNVQNIGHDRAKFILVGHGRVVAAGGYGHGNYVYVPGNKCWILKHEWPALNALGVKSCSWTSWPVEGVVDFVPKKGVERKGEYVYAFVPGAWAVVGDEKSQEYTIYQCSPIQLGKTVLPMPFWCVLHRDDDYLLELSLSRALGVDHWDEPWATVALDPGESAQFSVSMTPGQGLTKADFVKVTE